MKKRILLSGVTGYLGSHIAVVLLKSGYEVVGLKRRSSSLRRVEAIKAHISLFDVDELDFNALFYSCDKIDAIIHTATCYGRKGESVSEMLAANVAFPLRLLDAGSHAGVSTFFNTDTVLEKKLNFYALSKNQFLQWGEHYSTQHKIQFCNVKLDHFYGPGDDSTKFSAHVINSCRNNVARLKLTRGEQKRDFIHIDDVIAAYLILLEKMNQLNKFYMDFEVGAGRSVSVREFVETVHHLTGSDTNLDFGALPYREGEMMFSKTDISALTTLGWRCLYDLQSGLRQTIEKEGNCL